MENAAKPCIACAESIKHEAVLCRFCGTHQDNKVFLASRAKSSPRNQVDAAPIEHSPSPSLRTRIGFGAVVGGVLGLIILTTILVARTGNQSPPEINVAESESVQLPSDEAGSEPSADNASTSVKDIYDSALPSIVTVECGLALGSGFSFEIQPSSGYQSAIVTNHHVIEECTYTNGYQVSIVTNSGKRPSSLLWSWDEENDLALVMVGASLPPLLEADEGEIGDRVVAIGSPEGFTGTITSGIISQVYSDAYQTDAALNHGNSGGPLLDMNGRVLGINTLGIGREGLNIAFRPNLLCEKILVCD